MVEFESEPKLQGKTDACSSEVVPGPPPRYIEVGALSGSFLASKYQKKKLPVLSSGQSPASGSKSLGRVTNPEKDLTPFVVSQMLVCLYEILAPGNLSERTVSRFCEGATKPAAQAVAHRAVPRRFDVFMMSDKVD